MSGNSPHIGTTDCGNQQQVLKELGLQGYHNA